MATGDHLIVSPDLIQALALPDPDIEEVRAAVIRAYNEEVGESIDPASALVAEEGERVALWLREIRATRGEDLHKQHPRLHGLIFDGLEDKFWTLLQTPCRVCGPRRGFPGQTLAIRVAPRSYQYENGEVRAAFKRAVADDVARKGLTSLGDAEICLRLAYGVAPGRTTIDIDNITKLTLDALKGQLFDDDRQVVHLDLIKLPTEAVSEVIGVHMWPTFLANHSIDTIRESFEVIWSAAPISIEDYLGH